jgi:tetratricopeptide (TPR) repeat protein
MTDPRREIAEGTRLARRAVEFGQDDAVALARSGHALAHLTHEFDDSLALLDRSLVLDSNLAAGWYLSGFLRVWRGEPDAAIEAIGHGMRLSPLGADVFRMEVGVALAHLLAGRADEAASWAERASQHLSDFALPASILAASYARAGNNSGRSIPHFGSAISTDGFRSAIHATARPSPTRSARPACRNSGKAEAPLSSSFRIADTFPSRARA